MVAAVFEADLEILLRPGGLGLFWGYLDPVCSIVSFLCVFSLCYYEFVC